MPVYNVGVLDLNRTDAYCLAEAPPLLVNAVDVIGVIGC